MFDALQAETKIISRQAQALLQLPALTWLQHVQAELEMNDPNASFERLLGDVLAFHDEAGPAETFSTPEPPSVNAVATPSRQLLTHLTRSAHDKRSDTNRTQLEQTTTPSQLFSRPAPVTADFPAEERSASRSSPKIAADPAETTTTQGTRLVTEFDDLQSLLSALPRVSGASSSSEPAPTPIPSARSSHETPSHSSQTGMPRPGENDAPTHDSPLTPDRDASPYTINEQSGESSQAVMATRDNETSRAEHAPHKQAVSPRGNSVLSTLASRSAREPTQPVPHTIPLSNQPSTSEFFDQPHQTLQTAVQETRFSSGQQATTTMGGMESPRTTATGEFSIFSANRPADFAEPLTSVAHLNQASQDYLLEQLLDRLEERQREHALRSLGFTGGEI